MLLSQLITMLSISDMHWISPGSVSTLLIIYQENNALLRTKVRTSLLIPDCKRFCITQVALEQIFLSYKIICWFFTLENEPEGGRKIQDEKRTYHAIGKQHLYASNTSDDRGGITDHGDRKNQGLWASARRVACHPSRTSNTCFVRQTTGVDWAAWTGVLMGRWDRTSLWIVLHHY